MTYSRIIGTGSYLPEKVLTNAELETMVDTSHEWIVTRTGIHERRIAAQGEFTSDLAEAAAREAINAAGIQIQDIDLIVIATTTADQVFPSTACLLQDRLGLHGCPAFDVQAVCAGFVYALDVVDRFIKTGGAKCVLVIGAETFSRIIDWTDRGTCVLFGDGAGAMIIKADSSPGIMSTHLHADGQYKDLLCVPTGVSNNFKGVMAGEAYTTMRGSDVFKWAVNNMGRLARETLNANDLSTDELDWLVPHQANIRIITATAKKANVPMDKVVVTVAQHGNTSAASIPLAFDTAVRDGRIQPGHKVLLEGFGGGFTWGSVMLTM